jgi:hypothetical protein
MNCKLDQQHLPSKDLVKLTDDSTDLRLRMSHLMTQQSLLSSTQAQHQSITSTSSRKSSMSECGPPYISTSPNTVTTTANATYAGLNTISINSSEENTPTIGQNSLHQQAHANLAQSKSTTRILETIPYPKLFGAKFSGLPRIYFF